MAQIDYNDWKVLFNKDFWTKKEISFQYVHFTNSALISFVMLYIVTLFNMQHWYFYIIAAISGFITGICVEIYQWVNGNHKRMDAIRDLFFWCIGSIVGYLIYIK